MIDLYRIDLTGSFDIGANDSWEELFQEAKDEGLLVPVEPCEHGKYDAHTVPLTEYYLQTNTPNWCDGAGLEDSE